MKSLRQKVRIGLKGGASAIETKQPATEGGKAYAEFPIYPVGGSNSTGSTFVKVFGEDKIAEVKTAAGETGVFVASLDFRNTKFKKEDGTWVNNTDVHLFGAVAEEGAELGVQIDGAFAVKGQAVNFVGAEVKVEGEGKALRASVPVMAWGDKDHPLEGAASTFLTVFGQDKIDALKALSTVKRTNAEGKEVGAGMSFDGAITPTKKDPADEHSKVFLNYTANKIGPVPEKQAEAEAPAPAADAAKAPAM